MRRRAQSEVSPGSMDEESGIGSAGPFPGSAGRSGNRSAVNTSFSNGNIYNTSDPEEDEREPTQKRGDEMTDSLSITQEPPSHHHHIPTNAFLSIGLQTSLAIALHKLPEGFITYATNHANPQLGFAVFMALFIHNITEGFAMALPLFLALGTRWRAMLWSSLLGGVSQPLGAGVAALWLKLAGRTDMAPGEGVYGGMFAVTGKLTVFPSVYPLPIS